MDFEIGDEAREFMTRYEVREDAVRYAAANATSEVIYEDEDVVIAFAHDPANRRLRLVFSRDRRRLLQVRPVE